MQIDGKTAFITGGASGIGFEIAKSLGEAGAQVMIADLDQAKVDDAVKALTAKGVTAFGTTCDVSDESAMRAAADKAVAELGGVDILVNNAGVSLGGETGTIPLKDWRWIIDVNLMGVVHGTEIFTPLLKARGGGHIVNVASMAGHWASPGLSPYCATKFAVVGLSESQRLELEADKIGVSVLCPGFVRTNIHNAHLGRPSGQTYDDSAGLEAMTAFVEGGMPADIVGGLTLDAIRDNRLYIFTDPDMGVAIDARRDMIQADYAACADNPRVKAFRGDA